MQDVLSSRSSRSALDHHTAEFLDAKADQIIFTFSRVDRFGFRLSDKPGALGGIALLGMACEQVAEIGYGFVLVNGFRQFGQQVTAAARSRRSGRSGRRRSFRRRAGWPPAVCARSG